MGLQERFGEFVERHYDGAWRYAAHLTAGQDADDLVHDAFMAAFDRLAAGGTFDDPGSWLRGTLRHLAAAWWRNRRKLPQATAEDLVRLVGESADQSGTEDLGELRAALKLCLQELDDRSTRLLRRRYSDGWSISQLAAETGSRLETLRVWLFRIRQTLRACIERRLAAGEEP